MPGPTIPLAPMPPAPARPVRPYRMRWRGRTLHTAASTRGEARHWSKERVGRRSGQRLRAKVRVREGRLLPA